MAEDGQGEGQEPKIALRQVAATRSGATEDWSVGWKVENRGAKRLQILAARLPHGQFKSEELLFAPPLELLPGQGDTFQVSVRCDGPTGPVTENAFVIFQAIWLRESWRIFARIRVVIDPDGRPTATTESITTQKIGFSGVRS